MHVCRMLQLDLKSTSAKLLTTNNDYVDDDDGDDEDDEIQLFPL